MKICHTMHGTMSFGTNERVVRQGGKLLMRNCTRLLREDLDLDRISELLTSQSKHPQIFCYACSDASEVYSIKLALIKKLGLRKSNSFKIEARDVDDKMIEKAKSGIISLSPRDFFVGTSYLGNEVKDFFVPLTTDYSYTIIDKLKFFSHDISSNKLKEIFSSVSKDKVRNFFSRYRIASAAKEYKVADSIRTGINFEIGDLVKDAHNIDFDNTTIFFRNVWPYLQNKEIEKLLGIFKHKFTDKSFLILGYFDKKPKIINTDLNLPKRLNEIGLKEIYPKIYTKA